MRLRFFILAFSLATLLPSVAFAAALSVVPDATTVSVGDTFGITVYLNSGGTAINASDGTLLFSPALAGAQSVAYGNSIFTLWAQEPSIDNSNGAVAWSGGTSSSFNGSQGRVLRVTFVAKNPGVLTLSLPSSSIYADDGQGTDVATSPHPATVTIVNAATPVPVSTPAASAPSQPSPTDQHIALSSPTDPSEDAWYASPNVTLTWKVSSSADAVETLVSAHKGSTPSVTYRPAISQKDVTDLTDGIWYFNIRGHYASGWGPITSYRLQIDSASPVLSAAAISYDATSSALVLFAAASDSGSGVASYALLVDDATSTTFKPADVASGSYSVPVNLAVGTHTVQIVASDFAGNEASSKVSIVSVHEAAHHPSLITAWIKALGALNPILLIAILLAVFSLLMNIVLWLRLRFHERRIVGGTDVHRIRTLTLSQLTAFRKEVARETRALERAHLRRDITIEEAGEIRQMHRHLSELGAFIEKQITTIEKV